VSQLKYSQTKNYENIDKNIGRKKHVRTIRSFTQKERSAAKQLSQTIDSVAKKGESVCSRIEIVRPVFHAKRNFQNEKVFGVAIPERYF